MRLQSQLLLCLCCVCTALGCRREESFRPPPLARSPQGLLVEGAVEKIAEALKARGYLEANHPSSTLDTAISGALGQFQGDQGLPKTGAPDWETLRRLALDPTTLFARSASAERPLP